LLPRSRLSSAVEHALAHYPVTLLLGPRQCGKTTIARQLWAARGGSYFDLEDPETPLVPERGKLVLEGLRGLVVIDEVQRQADLLPLLRVLADRQPPPARFLLLGSASLDVVRGVSESLAGRVAFVDMGGFDVEEVGSGAQERLWIRGGFPQAFLAADERLSLGWRQNFARSFLERDIPQLGIRVPATTLRRFWTMVAHYHGQVWNSAEFARALGTKEDTSRRYLDILTGTFLVRQLPPWFENLGKRLVKSPKVYVRDSGMLHALLGLRDKLEVQSHPKLGLSWEGFALEQVISLLDAERDAYFYATHGGAELDLLVQRGGKRYGFEFKYLDAPRSTKSMHAVRKDLGLERLWIVAPGAARYPLAEGMEVVPLGEVLELRREIAGQ
jgi:predicted AAA+ superfamily ATPase